MLADRTHTKDDVEVLPDAVDEVVPEGFGGVLDFVFDGVWPYEVVDLLHIFLFGEEVGDLAGVQNIIDILEEGLIGDLDVCEDEAGGLFFATSLLGQSP